MGSARLWAMLALIPAGCGGEGKSGGGSGLFGDGIDGVGWPDPEPEEPELRTWYLDEDGDGFAGLEMIQVPEGDAPAGAFAAITDCDDENPAINPDAAEVCDPEDVDEDCDDAADDADDSVSVFSKVSFFLDGDGDGYGIAADAVAACDAPAGYAAAEGDCDDADPGRSPGAEERCDPDNIDEDCDGLADDADSSAALSSRTWMYADNDGDGYGDPGDAVRVCEPTVPGFVADDADCDDAASGFHPGADEDCDDGLDQDCDALVDCEDGGCAEDPICTENCADEVDNNRDGLLDCEDPLCVAADECTRDLRVTLGGGRLTFARSFSSDAINGDVTVRSAFGTVSYPESGSAACGWSFTYARFSFHAPSSISPQSGDLDLHTRGGFAVEEGCGADGSAFLNAFTLVACCGRAVGPPFEGGVSAGAAFWWYDGFRTDERFVYSYSYHWPDEIAGVHASFLYYQLSAGSVTYFAPLAE